jgi:DNA modification methylase
MPEESMGRNILLHGDVIEQLRTLDLESVDCVMTSPPYWGLRDYQLPPTVWDAKDGCGHEWGDHLTHRQRGSLHGANAQVGNTVSGVAGVEVQQGQFCQVCTAWRGSLGQEPTPDLFVAHLVAVFRDVRRVLKDTGTVWLNLGDSYAGSGKGIGSDHGKARLDDSRYGTRVAVADGLKPLDLCNIPHRVASALQADGWYWRSTIIWAKKSPMPESVNGTRWEKCRVKVGGSQPHEQPHNQASQSRAGHESRDNIGGVFQGGPEYEDCPGCTKCEGNDGLVLRRGSGRPTTAHEYLFLLTKTSNYYYDTEAVREGKRNLRSVWTLATEPSSDAHFATFPQALVEKSILAGTSAKGVCSQCGEPWARVVDVQRSFESGSGKAGHIPDGKNGAYLQGGGQTIDVRLGPVVHSQTLGWRPTCSHWSQQPEPATVLDPFAGTFTTSLVANRLGRNSIGIELNPEYIEMARNRLRQGSMVLEI